MKVWKLYTKPNCFVVVTKHEEDFETLDSSGKYIEGYVPIEVETIKRKSSNTDVAYYRQYVPVVNEKTKQLLEPLLGDRVQFCKLVHEKELWAINVIQVIDCLDKERTVHDNLSPGKIGYISELHLFTHLLDENVLIFKIPEQVNIRVYVTQAFIDFVNQHKIKGFEFIEMWDSEFTVEMEQEEKRQYEVRIAEINSQLNERFDWEAISPLLNQGRAFISDVYKIQYNAKGELVLGLLQLDLSYRWIVPIYLPPNILDYKWQEVERDSL